MEREQEDVEDVEEMLAAITTVLSASARRSRLKSEIVSAPKIPSPAMAFNNFGFTKASMGSYAEAREDAEHGLGLARDLGSAYQEARAYESLGAALVGLGVLDDALEHCGEALRVYTLLGCPESQDVRQQIAATRATLAKSA